MCNRRLIGASSRLAWCEEKGLALIDILPGHVSEYEKNIENLRTGRAASKDSRRLHLKDAGLPATLVAHSFRAATVTNLLKQGVPLEAVQDLAGHADSRTTRRYDHSGREVARNVVERIAF